MTNQRFFDADGQRPKLKIYGPKDLGTLPQLAGLSDRARITMRAVAAVLPFRVNSYVLNHLIDWTAVPDDPIYQLTFPQPGMLEPEALRSLIELARAGDAAALATAASHVQRKLNPHPGGQQQHNLTGGVRGLQHKYAETVLCFPKQGQTCHAYCTYCFRWAQFIGQDSLVMAGHEPMHFANYVADHPEVRSVLFTGGDPLIMRTAVLRRYIEPLLDIEHVQSIRLGTKSLSYWPQRFVTDSDADDLLRLFERVIAHKKQLAVMAHYSHWRAVDTPISQTALQRVRSAGATVRTQAPLIRHVNDDAQTWDRMWRDQTRQGAFPYYMFVERDTGARRYFEVPLARALEIYDDAFRHSSGLARTARGPVMSTLPGKVLVDGITAIRGERVFVLKLIQARDPSWVGRPFFARYDADASWLSDLEPAFGERAWFWQAELDRRLKNASAADTGSLPVYTSQ